MPAGSRWSLRVHPRAIVPPTVHTARVSLRNGIKLVIRLMELMLASMAEELQQKGMNTRFPVLAVGDRLAGPSAGRRPRD
jgi:hypothetical protein